MTTPLVSLMIPVYGAEAYIERCIRSVLNQTYDNLEVIVVNDATPDNSIVLLQRLIQGHCRESAFKIIHQSTNRGVAAARQVALEQAQGEYLMWLDSDDYLADNRIVANWIDLALSSGADLVSADYIADYKRRERYFSVKSYSNGRAFALGILRGDTQGFMWNKLIKRTALAQGYWIEGENILEDVAILLPTLLSIKREIAHLHLPATHYIQYNEHSLVTKMNRHKIEEVAKGLKRIRAFLQTTQDRELIEAGEFFQINMTRILLERSIYKDYAMILSLLPISNSGSTLPLNAFDRTMLHLQKSPILGRLGYMMAQIKRIIKTLYYGV